MLIVHVHVHVKPESVADFRQTKLGLKRTLCAGHVSPCGLEMNFGRKQCTLHFVGKAVTQKG